MSARLNFPLPTTRKLVRFQTSLLAWYAVNGRKFPWRRKRSTQYHLIVSEILLKRTRAESAADFFHSFVARYPSWKAISRASTRELGIALRPIGLWRQRATSLSALAAEMVARNGRFPQERELIESLPGVGQYVANAVMLFCHGRCEPLLDTGMARVLERCFGRRTLVDIRYDPWLQDISKRAVQHDQPAELNWAILDLAATTCHSHTPDCSNCPLRKLCRYPAVTLRRRKST
jgi:A/G-specific adenine glycosylase